MIEFTLGALAGAAIVAIIALLIHETQSNDWE